LVPKIETCGRLLAADTAGGIAVDCRGRGEQLAYVRAHAAVEQVTRCAGVVAVVFEWVAYRFRYDRAGREVHDGIDPVLAQHGRNQFAVADVTDDQRCRQYRLAKVSAEVVDRDHLLAAGLQLQQHMASDVACGAGNQDRVVGHGIGTGIGRIGECTDDSGNQRPV
jgi:hypothetical protein